MTDNKLQVLFEMARKGAEIEVVAKAKMDAEEKQARKDRKLYLDEQWEIWKDCPVLKTSRVDKEQTEHEWAAHYTQLACDGEQFSSLRWKWHDDGTHEFPYSYACGNMSGEMTFEWWRAAVVKELKRLARSAEKAR